MKIFLFLCAGLALGGCDKLDRTYLPPPGSKFSGGSPGAILGPLDSPKESTFPTSGTTGFMEQSLNNQPAYSQGPLQAQTTSTPGYGFTRQQRPGQFGGANNLLPPGSHVPGIPQAPFNPSVQNGIRKYQNQFNIPSTTTSYAFSQTTTYPPSEGDFETSTGPTDIPGQELAFGPIPTQNPSNIYQNNGFSDQSRDQEVPILQKIPSGTPNNRPGFMQRQQNNIIVNPDQSNLMDPQVDRNRGTLQSGSQYSGFPNLSQGYIQGNTPVDIPTTYQPSTISSNLPKTPGSTVTGSRDQYGNFVPSSVSQSIQGQSENPLQGNRQNYQVPILANNGNPFAPSEFYSSNDRFSSNAIQNQNLPSPSSSAQSSVSSANPQTQGTLSPSNEDFRTQGSLNTPSNDDNRFDDIPGGPTSLTSSNVSSNTTSSYKPTLPTYNGDQRELKETPENRPERVQAEADRNAVILNYEASITPDGDFSYSFDTSNGIHADESGTASDGVKAKGSYSYIGDDGKLYKVEYTADENGFRPQGDHLPTPPPIPEAILRVIEQANRDKEAGIIHDGSYDEEKYGYKKYSGLMDNFKSQPEKNNALSVNRPNSFRGATVENGNFNKNIDRNEPYESENNKLKDTTSSRDQFQLQPKLPSKYSKERNGERLSNFNRAPFKNEGRPPQTAYLDKTNTQNQFNEKYNENQPSSVQNMGPTANNNYNNDGSIARNKLTKTENDLNPANDYRKIEQVTMKPTNYPNSKQQYGYKNENTTPDLKITESNMSYKPNEGQNTENIANNESFRQYDNDGNIVTKIKLPNIYTKESDKVNKQPTNVFDPYIGTENQYLPTDSNDYDLLEETDFSIQPNSGFTMTTPSDNQSMDEKSKNFREPQKSLLRNNLATLDSDPLKKSTISRPSPYSDSIKGINKATDSSIDDEEIGYEYSRPQQNFNLGMTEFEKKEQSEDRNNIPEEFVTDKYGVRRPTARPSLGPQSSIITKPSLINSQQNVRPGLPTNQQFPPYSNEQNKIKTHLPSDTTQRPFGARIPTLAPAQNYPVTQRNQYNNRRVLTTPGRTSYPVDDTNMSTTPMSPEIPSELESVAQSGTYPTNQPSTITPIITESTSPSYYTDKGFPTSNIPSRLNGFAKNVTNKVQSGQIPSNNQVAISKSTTADYPGINSNNDNYGFNPNSDTTPNDGSRGELYRRPSQNNVQQYSTTPDYPKETPTYQPSYSTPSFNNNPTDPNNVFSTANPNYQGENSQEFNTPPGIAQRPTNVPFSSQDKPTGNFQQFNTPYSGRPQRPTFMLISSQNPLSDQRQFSTPSDSSQGPSDVPFSSQYQNNYPTTSRTQNLDYNGDFPATGINAGQNQKVPALNANYRPEGQSRPQETTVDSEVSVDLRPFKETTSVPANINREDFSGARRPQYFDPITGYHY